MHPSLLPDLRGPAPIVHALMKRRKHTGVTLQTMHPTKFDHGQILAQTPRPGILVPADCTPDDLVHSLGPLGADMLCHGIESGQFIDRLESRIITQEPDHVEHAPKITPEDRNISWETWDADEILLRDRVLGRLWDMESYMRCFESPHHKRVAFDGPWKKFEPHIGSSTFLGPVTPGQIVLVRSGKSKRPELGFRTCDGGVIIPSAATIDGEKKGTGITAFINHLTR